MSDAANTDPSPAPGVPAPAAPAAAAGEPQPCRPGPRIRPGYWVAAVLLLLCMPLLAYRGLHQNSVTVDEFAHMPAGYSYWQTGDFRTYSKNPPLIKLIATLPWLATRPTFEERWIQAAQSFTGWGPWVMGDWFMRANVDRYQQLFIQTRWVTLGLGMLTGVIVFAWSARIFGSLAGLLSLAAFAFCPTVLAHASVATTDAGAMLTFALALFALWAYAVRPTRLGVVLLGLAVGAALAAKLTAILLALLVPAVLLMLFCRDCVRAGDEIPFGRLLAPYAAALVAVPLLALLVVNASYGFKGTLLRPFSARFESDTLTRISPLLAPLPIPLPRDFIAGFDAQQVDIERSEGSKFYLNGQASYDNWWYYFPAAFCYKEPLALLLLLLAAAGLLCCRPRMGFATAVCLLTPLALGLGYMLFFNRLNIGVRYLLPLYPLLFVAIGRLALPGATARPLFKQPGILVAALLLAWQSVSVVRANGDYLSYFSEAVGGAEQGHHYLADSNVDWGQDLLRLAEFQKADPRPLILAYFGHVDPKLCGVDFKPPPASPVAGRWVVSVNYLVGLGYPMCYLQPVGRSPHESVQWLSGRRPSARVGRSLFVFDVETLP